MATAYRTCMRGSKLRCIRTALGSFKPTPADFWCTGRSKGPATHLLHSLSTPNLLCITLDPYLLATQAQYLPSPGNLWRRPAFCVQPCTSACQQTWKKTVGSQHPSARGALNRNGDCRPARTKLPRDTHKRYSLTPAMAFQEQKLPHPACVIQS